ncbi:hypothetical protein P0W64_06610 [Tsukamurella sp. 8F]|uniref:hypothetical protein n=1 Tax=unclassified Tsukamurella TaxID=2633480 RepID=UPI0023B887A8|nr:MULTISPECIES: hypothetical protein [unclassified Tsukamurella]MDF0530125.1 hypothetical protein [Tsukamurella sp. 8J]MDF0586443.1 hypothetical protein [Tsukamurella sp. 8F]
MTRVSVVGCSGAGKTTVAKRLASVLDSTFIELDALHWGPGWNAATEVELAERVIAVIGGDSWVVDGDYQRKMGTIVWDRADVVVWIAPPRWRVMWQVLRRTVVRGISRQELWNGNRESIGGLMFWRGDRSSLTWAWRSYPRVQASYEAAMSDPRFAHLTFHRLRTRRDVDDLVRAMDVAR